MTTTTSWAEPDPAQIPDTLWPSTDGGGLGISLGDWIGNQINSWFADLVGTAIKPLLNALAVTLLATPQVENHPRLWDLWKANAVIANSGFVLFVVVGGILAMGYQSVQARYSVKEILPRLVVAFLASNVSFMLAAKAIELANGISLGLLGQDFDAARATRALLLMVTQPVTSEIFYILLILVAVILLVVLLLTFVLRVALTALLVIAAPLALACHALPQTDGLARMWWRVFTGLLLIQVCQSLTLVTTVRIFLNQDGREAVGLLGDGQLYNLLLTLVLLIVLVRIPSWISRTMFMPFAGHRRSLVGRIITTAVAYKLAAPVLGALHLGRSRRGGSRTAGRTRPTRRIAAVAGNALPPLAAGTAARGAPAATAASAARGGPGPFKHAPVGARRPFSPANWQPAPIKHAPSAPAAAGKYRPTPRPQGPVPQSTPVYGYPRDNYYAAGPVGLGQMQNLRNRAAGSSPGRRPRVRPIISPDAPIPGTPEWPETGGTPRRKPPKAPRRHTGGRETGDGQ